MPSPQRTILEILDTPASKSLPEADQVNIDHLQSFWASCLDEDLIDRQGLTPLLDVVKEVVAAWRGTAVVESGADGVLVQQVEEDWTRAAKKGKKWDPKTKRDRLTAALTFLHSRGALVFLSGSFVVGGTRGADCVLGRNQRSPLFSRPTRRETSRLIPSSSCFG